MRAQQGLGQLTGLVHGWKLSPRLSGAWWSSGYLHSSNNQDAARDSKPSSPNLLLLSAHRRCTTTTEYDVCTTPMHRVVVTYCMPPRYRLLLSVALALLSSIATTTVSFGRCMESGTHACVFPSLASQLPVVLPFPTLVSVKKKTGGVVIAFFFSSSKRMARGAFVKIEPTGLLVSLGQSAGLHCTCMHACRRNQPAGIIVLTSGQIDAWTTAPAAQHTYSSHMPIYSCKHACISGVDGAYSFIYLGPPASPPIAERTRPSIIARKLLLVCMQPKYSHTFPRTCMYRYMG